jgi:MoxR-like ATPase
MVLATQNPIEQEGTYPLPEAQMDRFLLHTVIGYPSDAEEARILALVRGEEVATAGAGRAKMPGSVVLDARREVHAVHVADALAAYIVALVGATRRPDGFGPDLAKWIEYGASPRGTLALDRCARAHAWLRGSAFATPEDVRAVALDCLRHRLILSYEASAEGITKERVITELLTQVAPV